MDQKLRAVDKPKPRKMPPKTLPDVGILFENGILFGPDQIALIEAVGRTGSIAGGARDVSALSTSSVVRGTQQSVQPCNSYCGSTQRGGRPYRLGLQQHLLY
jgi:hypothetical protein